MDNADIKQSIVRIQELAQSVIERFGPLSGIELGLNRASVQWIEGFIERQRERRNSNEGVPEGLVNTLGSFLGESIVAATDGAWEWNEKQQDWGIVFAAGRRAFPFAKVSKQFRNGLEGGDSIVGFYDIAVEHMATGKLP